MGWGDRASLRPVLRQPYADASGRFRGATDGRATGQGFMVRRVLPGVVREAGIIGPTEAHVRKIKTICPACGQASTKQMPGGECPDDVACAERAARWGDL